MFGPVRRAITSFFRVVGELTLFGFRAFREGFRRPWEVSEIIRQIFEIGWRSGPLLIISGFAFGVVLALQTRASMESFGAQAMIPQAVSFGLFTDIGPLITVALQEKSSSTKRSRTISKLRSRTRNSRQQK